MDTSSPTRQDAEGANRCLGDIGEQGGCDAKDDSRDRERGKADAICERERDGGAKRRLLKEHRADHARVIKELIEGASWTGGGELAAATSAPWPILVGVIAMLTMTVGNFAAITQTNLKRLLAYSSIAHAGYMLMGIAAMSRQGIELVLFYLGVYLFMNLGAFLVVIAIRDHTGGEGIETYRGLSYRQPFAAVLMAVFLLSLTGLPPFAGFIGK